MDDKILLDLGDIVVETRKKLAEFNNEDVQLSDDFKDAFAKGIKNSGNSLEFDKNTVVISNTAGQKIYAPNQWFVLAAIAVPLIKEIMRYRNYTERFIDDNIKELISLDESRIKEKKDVYQLMRAGEELEPTKSMLSGNLRSIFCRSFVNEGLSDENAGKNSDYLIRFMSDSKWWLGGKGIERTNDYYVSPALGVLNLVNASQSYVATMTYLYINDKDLYNKLDIIVNTDNGEVLIESQESPEERNKRLFRYWLGKQVKPEGDSDAGNPYSQSSIDQYVSNVANTPLANMPEKSVFFTTSVGEVEITIEELDNAEKKNNTQRSAVRKYLEYVMGLEQDSISPVFKTDVDIPYENNRIVFGAPGTGKSYQIKKNSEDVVENFSGELERVTFHPDYSYSQFVGTYKPIMDEDGETIKYGYVPGPFMRVLTKALKSAMTSNPTPYILIVEEINRAKVAAVFGEVFQLLDRDDDGVSEYEIQASEDIRRYMAEEIGGKPSDFAKIRIPNNMFIWATMNSADQGVFPMDTAFKRRWNFEYLGINESEKYIKGVGKIMLPGSDEPVEWNMLRKAINDKMSSSEFKINEDKLMGPFFLSKKVIESNENGMIINEKRFIAAFKSKVIMYLYEDAVKQGKLRFFDGCDASKYSSVCEAFDKIGTGIFGATFRETFYDKQRNDA